MGTPGFQIKSATEADIPIILSFIKKLARYERLSREVVATEELLRRLCSAAGQRRKLPLATWKPHLSVLFSSFTTIPLS